MTTFKYPAFIFRQRKNAPLQVAFVAPAGEVLQWSGVPRKSDELLTGYQRFRDDRRVDEEIVPFFQNDQNCSPTAIIVALRTDAALGSCRLEKVEVEAGKVVETTLEIHFKDDDADSDDVFGATEAYIKARLAKSRPDDAQDDDGESISSEEDEALEEEDTEGEEEENVSVHLGTETLKRMQDLLLDKENWKKAGFRSAIRDYSKPAFLIDGQHRVAAGAKIGDAGIPFMVCGLFDAPWQEQVFHFTVVNLKPKKIPPALITSIAALSLTKSEQDIVNARLESAGVKMDEVTIMSLVAYDARSPFVDWVDMAVGSPKEKENRLGYGSMKRIAKSWHAARRTSLTQIAKQVFNTNSMREARGQWREGEMWFEFFCAFWQTIKEHYPEDLWRKNSANRLFIGAHLWALQEVILAEADSQMASHWHVEDSIDDIDARKTQILEKLLEVVRVNVGYFPKAMWSHEWAKGSQDTGPGRKDLVELFEKFISNGKKQGTWKNWKGDEWFSSKD